MLFSAKKTMLKPPNRRLTMSPGEFGGIPINELNGSGGDGDLDERINQMTEVLSVELDGSDILGVAKIKNGQFKATIKNNIPQKPIDTLGTKEMKATMVMLQDYMEGYRKGGEEIPIGISFDSDQDLRSRKWFEFIIEYAKGKIASYNESQRKKGVTNPKEEKEDEGNKEAAEKEDSMETKTEMAVAELTKEVATLVVILNDYGIQGLVEYHKKVKDFKIVECLMVMAEAAETKLLKQLAGMVNTTKYAIAIREALDRKEFNQDGSVEGLYRLPFASPRCITRLRNHHTVVTKEMFHKVVSEINTFKIDFAKMGKKTGLQAEIDRYKELHEKMQSMIDELMSTEKDGEYEGLEATVTKEYWPFLRSISAAELDNNPSIGTKSGKALREHLIRAYEDMNGATGTLDQKWEELQSKLMGMDATYGHLYAADKQQQEWNLNVTEGRGKGKGKGKGKGSGKGFCSRQARQGYCDREGCQYKAMTDEEYANRGECFADKAKKGSCVFKYHCKFRHAGDPEKLTTVMKNKCVHNRGSVNAAEIVHEGESSASEDEE